MQDRLRCGDYTIRRYTLRYERYYKVYRHAQRLTSFDCIPHETKQKEFMERGNFVSVVKSDVTNCVPLCYELIDE